MSRVPLSQLQIGPFWFVTFDTPARLYGVSPFPIGAVMRIIADCHEPAEILNLLRSADGFDGSAVEIDAGSLDVGDDEKPRALALLVGARRGELCAHRLLRAVRAVCDSSPGCRSGGLRPAAHG